MAESNIQNTHLLSRSIKKKRYQGVQELKLPRRLNPLGRIPVGRSVAFVRSEVQRFEITSIPSTWERFGGLRKVEFLFRSNWRR